MTSQSNGYSICPENLCVVKTCDVRLSFVPKLEENNTESMPYLYVYKTLRYVSGQGSAVSALQERNRTYGHQICRITCYTTTTIVDGILQSRYQVLLLSCNMFVRSHCRLHYTHQPFVYDTKYCWRHITKRFELNTVCKSFKIFN
jgi:hypothetical protein